MQLSSTMRAIALTLMMVYPVAPSFAAGEMYARAIGEPPEPAPAPPPPQTQPQRAPPRAAQPPVESTAQAPAPGQPTSSTTNKDLQTKILIGAAVAVGLAVLGGGGKGGGGGTESSPASTSQR